MALTTASLQGAGAPVRISVVRAFCMGGQRLEPGHELDVPASLAAELIGSRKAARAEPRPAPAPAPAARKTTAPKEGD